MMMMMSITRRRSISSITNLRFCISTPHTFFSPSTGPSQSSSRVGHFHHLVLKSPTNPLFSARPLLNIHPSYNHNCRYLSVDAKPGQEDVQIHSIDTKGPMKCVHPYSLYKDWRNGPKKGPLIFLHVIPQEIILFVTARNQEGAHHVGVRIFRNKSMDAIAQRLQEYRTTLFVEGFVFGCDEFYYEGNNSFPVAKSPELRRFVEELSDTGNLPHAKYAYWSTKGALDGYFEPDKNNQYEGNALKMMFEDYLMNSVDKWRNGFSSRYDEIDASRKNKV